MIKVGTNVQIGFRNNHPSSADQAIDLVEGKIIFLYTDFNSFTYYFFCPTDDISKFSNHFYPLDNGFIPEIKSIYSNFEEINNIIDYFGRQYRIVSKQDIIFKKIKFEEDGCKCVNCKEFYPMAVPNQPDNTLICYSCRDNPWR